LKEEIASLDDISETRMLSSLEVEVRKNKFQVLWRLLKSKEAMIFQRSKSKWLKEGDANSKFFHKCVKARAHRNGIKALKVGGEWVCSPSEVRRVVVDHFSAHFASDQWERPRLDGVDFKKISE